MSSTGTDVGLDDCLRQQEVVAELGRRANGEGGLGAVLEDATAAVAETLETPYAAAVRQAPGAGDLRVAHGVGWSGGVVGDVTVPAGPGSLAGYALTTGDPVVVTDFEAESRLSRPALLASHDVGAGVAVVVGPPDDPWGVLAAYAHEQRSFTDHEVAFLESVAGVLGAAVGAERAEQSRREQRALRERVVETCPAGVAVLDADGEVRFANERAEKLVGRSADELASMAYDDPIWDPVDARGEPMDPDEGPFRRVMETGEPVSGVEIGVRDANGERVWLSVDAAPLTTDEEAPGGVVVTCEDVTDERHLERELGEVLDRVTDAMYALDREWRFTYVNERAAELLGRDRQELLGEVVWDAFPGTEGSELEERFREAMATQEPVSFERYSDTLSIWAEIRAYPSETGLSVYFRDVTERREREREHERVVEALEAAEEGIALLDGDGAFVYVNDAYADVFGYEPGEMVGAHWDDDLGIEADPGYVHEEVLPTVERDGQWTGTTTCVRSDGATFPAEHSLTQTGDGELICVLRDVTERRQLEAELDEVFGRVSDAFYALDGELRFTHVNDRAEELLGYDEEALLGRRLGDRYPETEEVERMREVFRTAMETQEPTTLEHYSDLLGFWVEASIYPSETGVSVYFRDVTERRERERELALFRTLLDRSTDSVFVVDPETGRYLDVNDTACERRGYDREEFLELTVPDVETEFPDHEAWRSFVEDLEEEGSVTVDGRHRREDGSTFPVEVNASYVELDDEQYVFALARDVTERKERERELAESERRYRALVENYSNGAVALVDEDLRYQTVGGEPTRIAGLTVEDVEGRPVAEVLPPDLADELVPRYEAALEGESSRFDVERDGGHYHFLIEPIRDDDGEVFAALGMSQDVTEREEAKRRLAESEHRYRALAENFPNGGVGVYDEDLRYTLVTGTMWDDIEPDAADLEGETIWECLPPDTADDVEPIFRGALEGETGSVVSHLGGRTYRVWATPLRDADGDITGGQSFAVDITDQRRRERELAESERRYRTLAEHFPNGIVTLFDDDFEYQLAAGQAFADTPVDPGDVEGEHFSDVWDDETVEALRPAFEDALDGEDRTIEVTYEGREWLLQAVPIADGRGDVSAGMTMARDITERKEFEEAIRSLHDTSRELFRAEDAAEVAAGVVDAAADVLGLSDAALYLYDDERGDLTPAATATEVGVLWEDLPRVPVGDDTIVGHAYATGESARWDDIRDAPQFIGAETDMRAGVYAPIGDHGAVFAGSDAVGAFDERTRQLLELLAANAEAAFDRVERERKLEESERRYRTLVEHFPDGAVALFDEDLEYTVAGGQLLHEVGVTAEERVGESIYDIYPGDIVDELERHFEAALDGEAHTFELEFYDRHLHANTLPVRGPDGEAFAGMVVVQDVTERREQERELERALDLLEKTERIADVAGWEVDPETEAPYWSDHLFDILDVDYDEQPTLDQSLDVYHSEEDRAIVENAVEEALETGDPFDVEARFPRPAGDVGWLRVRGEPEVEDGEVVSLRGAVQDVTERKEREQALQESRNQLQALIDVLPVAVFVAEADGEIVEWNEAAEEVWGGEVAASDSVAEYDEYEAWWADTGERVEPHEWPLARALEGEEVTDPDEIRIKGFDGEYRTVLNQGMPVRNADGEVTRAVVTLVDITERREYQRKLEESNERLEQFAYAASHDLQEPLRMVSSYLQLLERRYADDLDEDAAEFIEFAVDGADRMREMIDALLAYSRVDTRGDTFEPVDLDAVFADVRKDLKVKIAEHDAEVTAGDLPRVHGDGSQLNQVFQNLLSNAIEYSGDAPPRVHVDAERAGDEWVVSVSDEGVGIDPEDHERAFEVFQSLHGHDEAGTGIGLALVERIVERHGGDIWLDSEPGEGTTVSFTLPAATGGEDGG